MKKFILSVLIATTAVTTASAQSQSVVNATGTISDTIIIDIPEDQTTGILFDIVSSDPDRPEDVGYTITNSMGDFAVSSPSALALTTAADTIGGYFSLASNLDYATQNVYQMMLTETDQNGLQLTVPVRVNVLNVNDLDTLQWMNSSWVSIAENTSIGTGTKQFSLYKKDGTQVNYADVTWTLTDQSGNAVTDFSVSNFGLKNADIKVASTLDFETKPTHDLKLTALYNADEIDVDFSITVTDVNENGSTIRFQLH